MRGVASSVLPENGAMPTKFLSVGPEGVDDGGASLHRITFGDGVGSAVACLPSSWIQPVLTGIDAVLADDHAVDRPRLRRRLQRLRLIRYRRSAPGRRWQRARRAEGTGLAKSMRVGVLCRRSGLAFKAGAIPVPWALSRRSRSCRRGGGGQPDVMACVVLPVMFVVVTTVAPSETMACRLPSASAAEA